MEWIEVIQLRPFAKRDMEKAVWTFQQLFLSEKDRDLKSITLLQGVTIENELSLHLHWRGWLPPNGKSGLGRQLAETFLEFGQINHSGWIKMDEHNINQRRKTNVEQKFL